MDAVTSDSGNDNQVPAVAPTAGEFLRSRRERLSPETAGLPSGGRRRTPGLRREELALLAGISVDYLTRLEQGRETNPSQDVLQALGRALQLSLDEWDHLVHLLGVTIMSDHCAGPIPTQPVPDTVLALLDQLDPAPAFVLTPIGDVAAWNRTFNGLMTAAGLFELDPPNLTRFTFLAPGARTFFVEWETAALHQVGILRAAVGRWFNDAHLRAMVGELSVASADFSDMWSRHEVATKKTGRKHLHHPDEGELLLEFQAMQLPDTILTLVTYLAHDTATEAALERLGRAGRSGHLVSHRQDRGTATTPTNGPASGDVEPRLRLVRPSAPPSDQP